MSVPSHIQLLRCVANYKALRFSSSISTPGQKMVNGMIEKSSRTGGKYVSVHLRFEEDMVAFSCCAYDGGNAEKLKTNSLREIVWKGKFKRKDRVILPGFKRIEGKCPLTPLEFASLLTTTKSSDVVDVYMAVKLALCSITLVTGLLIILRSETKFTDKAQAVTSLANKWHV